MHACVRQIDVQQGNISSLHKRGYMYDKMISRGFQLYPVLTVASTCDYLGRGPSHNVERVAESIGSSISRSRLALPLAQSQAVSDLDPGHLSPVRHGAIFQDQDLSNTLTPTAIRVPHAIMIHERRIDYQLRARQLSMGTPYLCRQRVAPHAGRA